MQGSELIDVLECAQFVVAHVKGWVVCQATTVFEMREYMVASGANDAGRTVLFHETSQSFVERTFFKGVIVEKWRVEEGVGKLGRW